MAFGDFKDFPKRTASEKELRGNAFEIASNPKNDGCQHGLASTVYKSFDEEAGDAITHGRDGIISEDQQLANK